MDDTSNTPVWGEVLPTPDMVQDDNLHRSYSKAHPIEKSTSALGDLYKKSLWFRRAAHSASVMTALGVVDAVTGDKFFVDGFDEWFALAGATVLGYVGAKRALPLPERGDILADGSTYFGQALKRIGVVASAFSIAAAGCAAHGRSGEDGLSTVESSAEVSASAVRQVAIEAFDPANHVFPVGGVTVYDLPGALSRNGWGCLDGEQPVQVHPGDTLSGLMAASIDKRSPGAQMSPDDFSVLDALQEYTPLQVGSAVSLCAFSK